MIAAPFLMNSGDRIAAAAAVLPLARRLKIGHSAGGENNEKAERKDHLIIIGFGLNGRNLSHAAAIAGIDRVIIELNPDTVRTQKASGEPIFYGDASQETVLLHAGIKEARALVIVISDPTAARRIIYTARSLNPKLHIITRTRFVSEIEPLYELGADEVIPEEYEASVELLTRVLTKYLVPRDEIERCIAKTRSDHYSMLRTLVYESPTISELGPHLAGTEIFPMRVRSGSLAAGRSLMELDLRKEYGVTVLAIKRGANMIVNPSPDQTIAIQDVVILLGESKKMTDVEALFGVSSPLSSVH
jgi:CPA2 family monovalent cation:H+ antiporter-2